MPRRYAQQPWDASHVEINDPIYLIPTGNRIRFYPEETLPVVARVVDVKRVYAYLKINPTDRDLVKMRLADGTVTDDESNSGWLTFHTMLAYNREMTRRRRLDQIQAAMTDVADFSSETVEAIYQALLDAHKIKF